MCRVFVSGWCGVSNHITAATILPPNNARIYVEGGQRPIILQNVDDTTYLVECISEIRGQRLTSVETQGDRVILVIQIGDRTKTYTFNQRGFNYGQFRAE